MYVCMYVCMAELDMPNNYSHISKFPKFLKAKVTPTSLSDLLVPRTCREV